MIPYNELGFHLCLRAILTNCYRLRAIVEPCIGSATDPVEFRTKPCRPEKPDSLRFEKKTKTCLTLKWTVISFFNHVAYGC